MKKINKEKGFTMVEVVIVLIIVGVLGYLAAGEFTKYINNSHIVAAKNFLGTKAPRAILACSGANSSVEVCDKTSLIDDWGLGSKTSTEESWSSVENKYGVTLTYPFSSISDASNTMSRVVTYLKYSKVGSVSTITTGGSMSISVFYVVK